MAVFERDDITITDLSAEGPPAPQLMSAAKIATIDAAGATKRGKSTAKSARMLLAAIGRELGFRD